MSLGAAVSAIIFFTPQVIFYMAILAGIFKLIYPDVGEIDWFYKVGILLVAVSWTLLPFVYLSNKFNVTVEFSTKKLLRSVEKPNGRQATKAQTNSDQSKV